MTTVWRSRPVFISSTFRDMHAERDHLRNVVFPELEERLRERRVYLEPIDLRLGVETSSVDEEHTRELHVLKVCLDEVERSRPYLIGLIGDRYGWIPPEDRMTAAAQEAGFEGDVTGKSVTEIEIEFGVFTGAAQQDRSLFYFRDPLPYDQMPPALAADYAEAYGPRGEAAQNKLDALKARIKKQLPERFRTYRLDWDKGQQTVVGLKEWGDKVLEDIWQALDAETADSERETPTTWQDTERWNLEQFIEDRKRDFTGRESLLDTLNTVATAQVDGQHGICVTGVAGAGKSALFAELHSQLQKQDIVLLAHAAGVSPRSGQVDAMLRRWVEELAVTLDRPSPISDESNVEEVEEAFQGLLGQTSNQRRVVVLIDALNQFEQTTRARYLTWLPKLWPPNARLIATAIPGSASAALIEMTGFEALPVEPLRESEARKIAQAICRRYHRKFNPAVFDALIGKVNVDRQPAIGNPLWLELAVEELNLLDADDFARAETDAYTGNPTERLHQLTLDVIGQLPGDVDALYEHMLRRAEKLHGSAWAKAFVTLTAVSRAGWRELDLQALMAKISGQPWDDLAFASLRRTFRAHVVQKGAQVQWDFAHAQMRIAIVKTYLTDSLDAKALHATIAEYLQELSSDDPVHESETMVHLIGADDQTGAANHYGGELTDAEKVGATRALVECLTTTTDERTEQAITWVAEMTGIGALHEDTKVSICNRINFDLDGALEPIASLGVRHRLLAAGRETVAHLVTQDPSNTDWQRVLSICHNKVGDVLLLQGDATAAMAAYREAFDIAKQLATQEPSSADYQWDLSVSHDKIGDVLRIRGRRADALDFYRAALALQERLVAQEPAHADSWEDLANLANTHGKVAEELLSQGDPVGALENSQALLRIAQDLADQDPKNIRWQRLHAIGHGMVRDAFLIQGDLKGALENGVSALKVAQDLADRDPVNAELQHDLMVNLNGIGDVLKTKFELAGALETSQAALKIAQDLADRDPENDEMRTTVSTLLARISKILLAQGDFKRAIKFQNASFSILKRSLLNLNSQYAKIHLPRWAYVLLAILVRISLPVIRLVMCVNFIVRGIELRLGFSKTRA